VPADLSRAACFGIDPRDSNFLLAKAIPLPVAIREQWPWPPCFAQNALAVVLRFAHQPSESCAGSRAGSRHGFCSCNLTRDACTSERQRQDKTVDPSNAIASSKTPKGGRAIIPSAARESSILRPAMKQVIAARPTEEAAMPMPPNPPTGLMRDQCPLPRADRSGSIQTKLCLNCADRRIRWLWSLGWYGQKR
jgi:hypothetical protein